MVAPFRERAGPFSRRRYALILAGARSVAAPLPDGSMAVFVWGGLKFLASGPLTCPHGVIGAVNYDFSCGITVKAELAYPSMFEASNMSQMFHVLLAASSPLTQASQPRISAASALYALVCVACAVCAALAAPLGSTALWVGKTCCAAWFEPQSAPLQLPVPESVNGEPPAPLEGIELSRANVRYDSVYELARASHDGTHNSASNVRVPRRDSGSFDTVYEESIANPPSFASQGFGVERFPTTGMPRAADSTDESRPTPVASMSSTSLVDPAMAFAVFASHGSVTTIVCALLANLLPASSMPSHLRTVVPLLVTSVACALVSFVAAATLFVKYLYKHRPQRQHSLLVLTVMTPALVAVLCVASTGPPVAVAASLTLPFGTRVTVPVLPIVVACDILISLFFLVHFAWVTSAATVSTWHAHWRIRLGQGILRRVNSSSDAISSSAGVGGANPSLAAPLLSLTQAGGVVGTSEMSLR